MIAAEKIFRRSDIEGSGETIDEYELYLHFFGEYVFYVNGGVLTDLDAVGKFGKTREICRKLDEYSVRLYTAHDAGYGLTDLKAAHVFFPRSEELLVRYGNTAKFFIDALYHGFNKHSGIKPVFRMRDP